jgi:hypothetical protein
MYKYTRHETRVHSERHETAAGTVVECRTTTQGTSDIAEKLSVDEGVDLVASSSTWYFKGEKYAETANFTGWLLGMMINNDPNAVGRFKALGSAGAEATGPGQPLEEKDPFISITIGAPSAFVTQQEVNNYSHQLALQFNEVLPGSQSDLQLPLPPQGE